MLIHEYSVPIFLRLSKELASVSAILELWQAQHSLSALGRIETVAWDAKRHGYCPWLSTEWADKKWELSPSPWRGKMLVWSSKATTFLRAAQRTGFWLAFLRVMKGPDNLAPVGKWEQRWIFGMAIDINPPPLPPSSAQIEQTKTQLPDSPSGRKELDELSNDRTFLGNWF